MNSEKSIDIICREVYYWINTKVFWSLSMHSGDDKMREDKALFKSRDHRSKTVQQRIYDCAIELFTEKGFNNVKVSDICAAANVSTGTFYYYFPSKESVFFGYADAIDDLIEREINNLMDETAEKTLKNLVMYKLRTSIKGGAELSNVSFTAELKHNKDVALDIKRVAYGYYMNTIERGIRSGEFRDDINLYTATSLLRYMIGGLVLHWAILGDDFDIDLEAERLTDLFLTLLKPYEKER